MVYHAWVELAGASIALINEDKIKSILANFRTHTNDHNASERRSEEAMAD